MKAKLIIGTWAFLSLVFIPTSSEAQVAFSKFVFKLDSPFGMAPTRKMTDTKFKVTGDKTIKKFYVSYVGVDQVGDAVTCTISRLKKKRLGFTGPFEPGKTYSPWASATFWYPLKLKAFPYLIEFEFMDGTKENIEIGKENINKYFTNITWQEVNYGDEELEDSPSQKQDFFEGLHYTPDSITIYPDNQTGIISFVMRSANPKETTFRLLKQWAAKNFEDYKEAVQMEDMEGGTLIFKGANKLSETSERTQTNSLVITPTLKYTMTIDIKEDRLRVKFEDLILNMKYWVLWPDGQKEETFLDLTIKQVYESQTSAKIELTRVAAPKALKESKIALAQMLNAIETAIMAKDDF